MGFHSHAERDALRAGSLAVHFLDNLLGNREQSRPVFPVKAVRGAALWGWSAAAVEAGGTAVSLRRAGRSVHLADFARRIDAGTLM